MTNIINVEIGVTGNRVLDLARADMVGLDALDIPACLRTLLNSRTAVIAPGLQVF